jgi:V/A-type H+-transporting ATPase subunit K
MGLWIGVAGIFAAVGIGCWGSSVGLRYAGNAVNAAMIEEPKLFGKYLVLTVLPGTQGIYGFVIGFLAISKVTVGMSVGGGLALFFACLACGFTGYVSSSNQGRVCASGIEMTVKHNDQSGKALVLAVFIEFYSIFRFCYVYHAFK